MGFLGRVSERRGVECSTLDRWQMPGRDYNLKSISFDLRDSRHQTLDHSELSDIKINILPPTVVQRRSLFLFQFIVYIPTF